METPVEVKRPKTKPLVFHNLETRLTSAYEDIKQLKAENRELKERLRIIGDPSYPTHGW